MRNFERDKNNERENGVSINLFLQLTQTTSSSIGRFLRKILAN